MKYFAVITNMLDLEKNQKYREEHLDYLKDLSKKKTMYSRKEGFPMRAGGLLFIRRIRWMKCDYSLRTIPLLFRVHALMKFASGK